MVYQCAGCGETFFSKTPRPEYKVMPSLDIYGFNNFYSGYICSPPFLLCDLCTKMTGIDQLFKEDRQ